MICYSCQKDLPAGVAVCPNCGQAVYCFGDGKAPSVGRVLNGCLMGAPSPKDYVATPRETNLPRRVDLRPDCPPVEDQGQLSSCTSNAACGAWEYQRRKSGQGRNGMSRLFVYFNARRLRNEERDDSGAEIPEVMAALLAYGTP